MKILSYRGPWGFAVTDLGKRLENRTWSWLKHGLEKFREHVAADDWLGIHQSATPPKGYDVAGVLASSGLTELPEGAMIRGHIIGVSKIIDILRTDELQTIVENTEDLAFPHYVIRPEDYERFVRKSKVAPKQDDNEHLARLDQLRRWWMGPYALVHGIVLKFSTPIKASGALGLWESGPELDERIREQMTHASHRIVFGIERPLKESIKIIEDASMPPGTMDLRLDDQVVRLENIEMSGPMPTEQLSMFTEIPPPKRGGSLH